MYFCEWRFIVDKDSFEKLVKFVADEIINKDVIWDIKETDIGFDLIFNKKDTTVDNPSERIRKTEEIMGAKLRTQINIVGRLTYKFEWV